MPDEADDFDLDSAFTDAAAQPAEADAPAPVESTPSPLFSKAQEAGLDLGDIKDESGLAEFLLNKYTEQQPYVQYGQQYLATASSPKENAQEQQGQAGDKAGDEGNEDVFDLDGHFTGLWKANELSPQARWAIEQGIVSLDPNTGLYAAKQGFEQIALPILNGVNEAHIAQKQQLGKLFEGNPYKAIYEAVLPAIKHELTKEFQQYNQQSFQTYEQQGYIENWKKENASWLFQAGTQNLTPDGLKFAQTVEELQQQGISDPKTLASYAMRLAGINPQAAKPPQAGAPSQVPAAKTQAPAQPATGERQRGPDGKFLPAQAAEAPKSKEESFLEKAKRVSAASSSQNGYDASNPDHAVVANQGDLDSMFSTAYRQSLAAA